MVTKSSFIDRYLIDSLTVALFRMKNPNPENLSNGTSPSLSNSRSNSGAPERDIDLYGLMSGVAARWRMIAALVGVTVVLAVAILMFTQPRYSSGVRILFGNTEAEILNSDRQNSRPNVDKELVRSQIHVLQSRDLMAQVIKDLDLVQNPEFVSSNEDVGFKEKLLIWMGFASDSRLMPPEERAWMTLEPRVVVYPLPDSRVLALDVWSYDPELAAAIANRLGQVYLNETKAAKSRSNKQAKQWLAGRIQGLEKKVRKAEAKIEQFRAQAGLLQGTTNTLNAEELSGVKGQIIVASANRSQAMARVRQIKKLLKNGGDINTSNEVLQSQLIGRLREQQVTLRRLIADLSAKYLPSHPRMVRLRAEIAGLSRQVRAEMRKIISSLQGQVDVATARLASLNASLDRVKVTAEQANEQRVRLKALEREASASSQLLETYLRRFSEASARADIATQSPNARIISKAYVASTPSYPKKGPILILLTLGALVLGVTIAFLLELFSLTPAEKSIGIANSTPLAENKPQVGQAALRAFETFKTTIKSTPSPSFEKTPATMDRQENENASLQVSIIADLPVISHENPRQMEIEKVLKGLILDDKNYRQGIVNMQNFISKSTPSGRGTKILAMSNMHNFDKSMAALALTRKLSAEGRSVLLIDADFQMQNLSRSLNLMAFDGITDLLTGAAQFSDVVIQDTHSSAHIISAGERVEFHDEDDVDARLEAVVDAFSHAYDYIIIDGGMAYPGAPMWSLIASSDCNLVFMAISEIEDVVSDLVTQVYERSPEGALGIVSVEDKSSIDALKSMKLFRHDTAA